MAGYSRKIKSVAELKDGATIAIPNDPTNLGRALLLLQKEKLITLKAGTGLLPTAVDITDNPRNLKIMELEGAQLPRVLTIPKSTWLSSAPPTCSKPGCRRFVTASLSKIKTRPT